MSISIWGMSAADYAKVTPNLLVGFYCAVVMSNKEASIDITRGGIVKHHGSVSELPAIVQRM